MYQRPGWEAPSIMFAHELHTQLRELQAQRALAQDTGVARIGSYMADLERDIARSHAAFVGAGRAGGGTAPTPPPPPPRSASPRPPPGPGPELAVDRPCGAPSPPGVPAACLRFISTR